MGNHDSQGGECTDACHQMEGEGKVHYKCNGKAGLVDCGFWGHPEVQKKTLEFTADDEVCAGPCVEKDGEKGQARLVEAFGNCGEAGWGWVEWVILVAGILGGLLVIGIVAFVVSKKGYTRAASSGA